ncbi:MAG TPA: NAD(P)-dependent oxidoreductase [Gemmataceae bacterium]|nr:NAD(P)-dependent oxidoreductase [Gemmataceae bacterium]
MPSRERVLISGASGFIGACLAHDLVAEGHDVHLILRPEAKTWRLAGLQGRCTAHAADLCDADALRRAVAACRPDVVYHLAAHGAYPSQRDRAAIFATNLAGTANLLDALDGHDYRALVHTGSSSEYGHKAGPVREDDRPEPRSDYAVAKAAATLLCQAEAHRGRPVTTVRVFSAYGPWEGPSRLVPYVVGCCLRGQPPRVTAGRQPRDFIYVADVVDLLKVAAHHPQAPGQILHAGTARQHTVRDMIETIVAVCGGGRVRPDYGGAPARPDEPATWVASIAHTTALTGWRPRHDLSAGIRLTRDWTLARSTAAAAVD